MGGQEGCSHILSTTLAPVSFGHFVYLLVPVAPTFVPLQSLLGFVGLRCQVRHVPTWAQG